MLSVVMECILVSLWFTHIMAKMGEFFVQKASCQSGGMIYWRFNNNTLWIPIPESECRYFACMDLLFCETICRLRPKFEENRYCW